MMRRSRKGRTATMMMMTIKIVPVLKTLSLFADEAGTVSTFLATLDKIGKTSSWSLHQSSTLESFLAKLKVSYWIISLLMGGIRLPLRCWQKWIKMFLENKSINNEDVWWYGCAPPCKKRQSNHCVAFIDHVIVIGSYYWETGVGLSENFKKWGVDQKCALHYKQKLFLVQLPWVALQLWWCWVLVLKVTWNSSWFMSLESHIFE